MHSISLIVPVYNVDKYLIRCLESIKNQTFMSFECILINDASTDNSAAICNDYSNKDNRFRVVHKTINEGSSQARRTGFEESSGSYILCIDSDDWIEPDMLEKMYKKAIEENLDIVCCDFYFDKGTYKIYNEESLISYNKILLIKDFISFKLHPSVWNKLVKRNIYEKVVFPFHSVAEDQIIIPQIIFYSEKIGYINKAFYHYCFNSSSLTYNIKTKEDRKNDRLKNWYLLIDFLKNKYGDHIIQFEPELSDRINLVRISYLLFNKSRDIDMFLKLYPYSNNFIFNKTSNLSIMNKIILFLATKKILYPLYFLDILKLFGK
jgi:glycosyltransferase involved in cell wall biosynthesis